MKESLIDNVFDELEVEITPLPDELHYFLDKKINQARKELKKKLNEEIEGFNSSCNCPEREVIDAHIKRLSEELCGEMQKFV